MALPALLVLALVTVVAIAATGSTPERSRSSPPPSTTLLDVLFTIGVMAFLAGTAIFLYGLTQRKAIAREIATGRYRRGSLATWIGFVAVFTAFTYWRIRNWERPPLEDSAVSDVISGGGAPLPTPPAGTPTAYEPSISWIPIVVAVLLALAATCAYIASRRRGRHVRDEDELLATALASALDDALDDLRAETDPRRAVIAAYARLERVLAAHGTPRRAAETADEYLPRVLRELEIDPAAIERLTTLFTEAKFSRHDVDVAMKDEAIDALVSVRDELRLVGERRATAGPVRSAVAVP